MSENEKEAVDKGLGSLGQAIPLPPDQLNAFLGELRKNPDYARFIEEEAEKLGILDPDDSDVPVSPIGGSRDAEEVPDPIGTHPITAADLSDDRYDRFRQLMSTAKDGYLIVVKRKEPGWASGIQAELEADESDPLTLSDIEREHGGGKFVIQVRNGAGALFGQTTIKIVGAPKKFGRILYPPEIEEDRPRKSGDGDMFSRFFIEMQKTQAMLLQTLLQRSAPELPVEQMRGLAELMSTLKGDVPEASDSPDFLSSLEKIMRFIPLMNQSRALPAQASQQAAPESQILPPPDQGPK